MRWRKDVTVPEDEFSSALQYYSSVRNGMREKSNHNKFEAQCCFATIIVCTLLAPLFVTLGEGVFFAKVVPSLLSVTAGGLTSWLQLRKPQRLWVLYRRAQRELEEQKANYDFKDEDFASAVEPDKLLASKVTHVARWVHDSWEGLVPEPEMLANGHKNKISNGRKAHDTTTNS
jgi:hypothetical protein